MAQISRDELAALLVETGKAHHAAYAVPDSVDPEWASWYAPYLQTQIGDRLGWPVTRSLLTFLLVRAERQQARDGDASSWPDYDAGAILER